MIGKAIKYVLFLYDKEMADATALASVRDANLSRFKEVVTPDVERVLTELASADERITIKPKLYGGWWVCFKDEVLFGVGINVFTDRAEIVVDKQVVVKYLGREASYLDSYDEDCEASLAMASQISVTFSTLLREYTDKRIERL